MSFYTMPMRIRIASGTNRYAILMDRFRPDGSVECAAMVDTGGRETEWHVYQEGGPIPELAWRPYDDSPAVKEDSMATVRTSVDQGFAVMAAADILEGRLLGNRQTILNLRNDRREMALAIKELDRRIALLEDQNDELSRLMMA